jgi:nicotinamidase-related amidase
LLAIDLRRNGRISRLIARRPRLIVVDMWDDYWCRERRKRYATLAERIGAVLPEFRKAGGRVIHAPCATMEYYAGTRARLEAHRWSARNPPKRSESTIPALQMNTVCQCEPRCETREDFLHAEHPAICIGDGDIISDDVAEIYTWLRRSGSDLLLFSGVNAESCVLYMPFGIAAASQWGIKIGLVRDLTETFDWWRTEDAVAFVEEHYCGSVDSGQIQAARSERKNP